MSPGLVRTLRIRSKRRPGGLGLLASALGDAGASLGEIQTVRIGHNTTLRDFQLLLDDEDHLAAVLEAIRPLEGCEVVEVIDTVERVHRGGKIRMRSTVAFSGVSDLSAALLPGMKQAAQSIADDAALVTLYTSVARTIAVVTDGSGVTGLDQVEAAAALPVVEAKCALLAHFAGLSGLPLCLDIESEDRFVDTMVALAPSYAGILVESVSSPRGPRVAQRLAERLKIPVFHDGADGPAIVGLAAIVNAVRSVKRNFADVVIGQIGLGTAGGAIARLVMKHQGRPVLGEDFHPGSVARHVFYGGKASSIEEIMSTCDVVVMNTGAPGLIKPSQVREGQVILALSEPRPEIEPYDAQLAGAAFAADGRAISTASAFPGVMLGALAVQATGIDDSMRIAAALAMVELADGHDLVPVPLQPGIHAAIAAAVARAAVQKGLARVVVDEAFLVPALFEELIADERLLPLRAPF
ncbi:MAG: NAD-dependent malic enzyme [Deltaproteobacteria bacterium]|nr:NAD-dependent malic enzyme [Deltaproteobacteria bacterium]